MDKKYILNRETGKLELHFEKSEYETLPDELKSILRSNFLFSRKAGAWVSRAKFPNLYNAKSAAAKLGFTEEEKVGERLSFAEQLQQKTERAEARADRYLGYAVNAEQRGAALQKDLKDRSGDIAFFTQPIIPGHAGSESFARRRQQIYACYDRGMEEYRKSEYFRERAATAQATADNGKLKDMRYLNNRIKECQSSIKKLKANIAYYEKLLEELKDPDSDVSKSGRYTTDKVTGWLEDSLERIEMLIDKQGFFENCVEELGGVSFGKESIKPGYVVMIRKSKFRIVKVNPKTVLARCLTTGMLLSYDYAEIKEVVSAEEEKPKSENHPFQKDDILIWDPHGRGKPLAVYQVIGVTEKSVQIRELKLSDSGEFARNEFADGSSVIRRNPSVSAYSCQWQVRGDYDRVLRKYAEEEVSSK